GVALQTGRSRSGRARLAAKELEIDAVGGEPKDFIGPGSPEADVVRPLAEVRSEAEARGIDGLERSRKRDELSREEAIRVWNRSQQGQNHHKRNETRKHRA